MTTAETLYEDANELMNNDDFSKALEVKDYMKHFVSLSEA